MFFIVILGKKSFVPNVVWVNRPYLRGKSDLKDANHLLRVLVLYLIIFLMMSGGASSAFNVGFYFEWLIWCFSNYITMIAATLGLVIFADLVSGGMRSSFLYSVNKIIQLFLTWHIYWWCVQGMVLG